MLESMLMGGEVDEAVSMEAVWGFDIEGLRCRHGLVLVEEVMKYR